MLDIHPELTGFEDYGPEPSLRELVYKYYATHFTHEESLGFTRQYFAELFQQLQDEVQS